MTDRQRTLRNLSMRFRACLFIGAIIALRCAAIAQQQFSVDSSKVFVPTGINMQAGQTVHISASGTVNIADVDGPYSTDPNGVIVTAPPVGSGAYNYFKNNGAPIGVPPVPGSVKLITASGQLNGAPYGALVAGISTSASPSSVAAFPNGFSLIGSSGSFTAPIDGYLFFAVNDVNNTYDNVGSFSVSVSSTDIPPSVQAKLHLQATEDVLNQVFTLVRGDPNNAGKTENQIASIAWGAIVDARNGNYGLSGEFSFLANVDLITIANADHFAQAYYVSTGNSLTENQITGFVFGAIVDPVYNIGKAITQSFGFDFLATGQGSQSPANFDFWALAGAQAAFNNLPPGQLTDPVPDMPISSDLNSSVLVVPPVTAESPITLDPPAASGYTYFVLYGSLIHSVSVPATTPTVDGSLTLASNGSSIALVPGQNFIFPKPVNLFTIKGIDTTKISGDFTSTVSFAGSGLVALAQVTLPPYGQIVGDINGDGVVNCLDLQLVKAFFGRNSSQPGFDSRADVNGDGIVNVLDLSFVSRQLPAGTVCQ